MSGQDNPSDAEQEFNQWVVKMVDSMPIITHNLRDEMDAWLAAWAERHDLKTPRVYWYGVLNVWIGPIDAHGFELIVGRKPESDDLERANCDQVGAVGHLSCGWCETHGKPRFTCGCAVVEEAS